MEQDTAPVEDPAPVPPPPQPAGETSEMAVVVPSDTEPPAKPVEPSAAVADPAGGTPGTIAAAAAYKPASQKTRASKKRKSKVLRDVTAPRQPLTGYVRYLNEHRDNLRSENPQLGFAEVTRRLASEWGRLPAEQKQQYLDAAEQDRVRYIEECSAYKETEAYRSFKQQQQVRKDKDSKEASQAKKPRTKTPEEHAGAEPAPPPAMSNGIPPPPCGALSQEASQRETDIPIFTEQFLQHNKLRETELRQLRKANTDLEHQNAILQKHVDNIRVGLEKVHGDSGALRARTAAMRTHLQGLVERLLRGLTSVTLPGGVGGATKNNITRYMEALRSLAVENRNHAAVRQAREYLSRMDMPA